MAEYGGHNQDGHIFYVSNNGCYKLLDTESYVVMKISGNSELNYRVVKKGADVEAGILSSR